MNKALITQAFQQLGPTRVERGLTAYENYGAARGNGVHCFLGRATPLWHKIVFWPVLFAFALGCVAWDRWISAIQAEWAAPFLYGLRCETMNAVTTAFDSGESKALKQLAEEWLELNRENREETVLGQDGKWGKYARVIVGERVALIPETCALIPHWKRSRKSTRFRSVIGNGIRLRRTNSLCKEDKVIGHYLSTLTVEEEDRVLTGKLGAASGYVRADSCRCLVGNVENVRSFLTHAKDLAGTYRHVWYSSDGEEYVCVVGIRFDDLCARFGDARIANVIRDRILSNRARRTFSTQLLQEVA